MLELRKEGAREIQLSGTADVQQAGNLGFVELSGAGSTLGNKAPSHSVFNNRRVNGNLNKFFF